MCAEYKIIICYFSSRTNANRTRTHTHRHTQSNDCQMVATTEQTIHMHNSTENNDNRVIKLKSNVTTFKLNQFLGGEGGGKIAKSMCILWHKSPRRRYKTCGKISVDLIKFYGFHGFALAKQTCEPTNERTNESNLKLVLLLDCFVDATQIFWFPINLMRLDRIMCKTDWLRWVAPHCIFCEQQVKRGNLSAMALVGRLVVGWHLQSR